MRGCLRANVYRRDAEGAEMRLFSLAGERPPREKLPDLFSVENTVLLRLKSCEEIKPIQKGQCLTCAKLTGANLGFLLNFHATVI